MAGTGIFDCVADPAGDADLSDQREDNVLDRYAGTPSAPSELDAHAFLLALTQRLRREDAFALTRADPECHGAEGAMGAGVAVAAYQGAAGKREPGFGPDDVDDPMTMVVDRDVGNSEALSIASQARNLPGREAIGTR